jgi:hypothetical protein
MSKSAALENKLLKLIFLGTTAANLADNATSSPLTNFYLALHTDDPGDAGTQETLEAAYEGYARAEVARSAAGWTVTGSEARLAEVVSFPACTADPETYTYFSIGTLSTGAGEILYSGELTPYINVIVGFTPQLGTGTVVTED